MQQHYLQAEKDAANLFKKWSNPYRGTIYAKYDKPAEDQAATTQLAQVESPTAKLRQLAAESLRKQKEARASCNGSPACEAVLQQVLLRHVCNSLAEKCRNPGMGAQVLSLFNAPAAPAT